MAKVGVLGARGRMGREVVRTVTEAPDLEVGAEVDQGDALDALTGCDVVVAGGDDVVVPARPQVRRYGRGHGGTSDDRQRPALAEVVLDVHDQKGSAHGASTEASASARLMRTR